MTDLEYMDRAERLLMSIELGCDRICSATDVDIDSQRVGGMVTLTFANKKQIVVNLQKPLHEVWMAVEVSGLHYRFDGQVWRDSRYHSEFFSDLSRYASEQAGQALSFI